MPMASLVFVAPLLLVVWQTWAGKVLFVGDSIVFGFYIALCLGSLNLGFSLGRRESQAIPSLGSLKHLLSLASILLIAAALSCVVAWLQVLETIGPSQWIVTMPSLRRPGGNIGQPNHLATLLLMGVASLLYLYESQKLGKLSSALLGAVLMTGLMIAESRTGVLSFWLMALWWIFRRQSAGLRMSPFVIIGACATLPLMLWLWPRAFDYLLAGGAIEAMGGGRFDVSAGERWLVWPQLMEAVALNPWFGWGIGGVASALNAVLGHYAKSGSFHYAHNIVLDLAIGFGIPFTLCLVALVAWWLQHRLRHARALTPCYAVALVIPFAVHSMLEYPFAYAYLLAPAMLGVGVLEGRVAGERNIALRWWPTAICVFGVIVTMTWSLVEYISLEEDFRVARFEALHVGKTASDYQVPNTVLLTQLSALAVTWRRAPAVGMGSEDIDSMRKVALRFPSVATYNRYALSLALNGNIPEASHQLKVIRALYGEASYDRLKQNWANLGKEQHPELSNILFP